MNWNEVILCCFALVCILMFVSKVWHHVNARSLFSSSLILFFYLSSQCSIADCMKRASCCVQASHYDHNQITLKADLWLQTYRISRQTIICICLHSESDDNTRQREEGNSLQTAGRCSSLWDSLQFAEQSRERRNSLNCKRAVDLWFLLGTSCFALLLAK